ncbi:hypothetical protein [Klebsiella variicola]|uniref:hypothetical protein n=1 Tax=Klebsiella variicola TaxID=244366 RepID=UPI001E4A75F9|nr:hypothetical protein [Klebsiella variicola]MCC7622689.1 hypothetical protein [Klebsiella variicola]MCC7652373.1 hypothetical protein [Klebsiella variicola]
MTTDITELAQRNELLIANGQQTADLLRHLDKIDIENLSSPWELSSEVVAFVNSRLLREGADK